MTEKTQDSGNSSTILFYANNTSSTTNSQKVGEFPFASEPLSFILIISSVFVFTAFITVIVCYYYCKGTRGDPVNTHDQRNESETELYQNSNALDCTMQRDSTETVDNRPLPQLPVETQKPPDTPAVIEDVYLRPLSPGWNRTLEEIRRLPPAPPVYPRELERLAVDGEGAYTPVIKDDEVPLLSPGPMHEITSDEQWCELTEETGYMVPKMLPKTPLQQKLTETEHKLKVEKTEYRENKKQMRTTTVVKTHGLSQKSPRIPERSFSEGSRQDDSETPYDATGRTYRISCHLYLSESTSDQNPRVFTSKSNIVLRTDTNPQEQK